MFREPRSPALTPGFLLSRAAGGGRESARPAIEASRSGAQAFPAALAPRAGGLRWRGGAPRYFYFGCACFGLAGLKSICFAPLVNVSCAGTFDCRAEGCQFK